MTSANVRTWPLVITVLMNPVAASRPRVSKWGTYYAGPYKNYRDDIKNKLLATQLPHGWDSPFTGALDLDLVFGVKRPAKPTKPFPHPDVDNYIKAILDALQSTGMFFVNDNQIITVSGTKRFVVEDEEPFTRIVMQPIGNI